MSGTQSAVPVESAVIPDAAGLFDFFDSALTARAKGCVDLHAAFGEDLLHINFHGFAPDKAYGRALLRADRQGNAFTIDVIDGAACGIAPRLGWQKQDFGLKRTVAGWSDDDRTTWLLHNEQGVAVADWRARRAFVWLPSQDAVPWYERAAPFRWLFDGLAERSGRAMVHAACVATGGKGLLIVGRGGAGKSTLALACLGAGFDYLGDDYCLVDSRQDRCFAVYTSAKWKSQAAVVPGWISRVTPDAREPGESKNILFLADHMPERLGRRTKIAGILLPVIDAAPDAISDAIIDRVSGREALLNILPSTLIQSEAGGNGVVESVGALVRAVRAWRLRLPRDVDRSVAAVRAVFAGLDE